MNILLDGVYIFGIFFGRIGIIHTQIAPSAVFFRCSKVDNKRFTVSDMQIPIRFRRETRVNFICTQLSFSDVLVNRLIDKIVFYLSHISNSFLS